MIKKRRAAQGSSLLCVSEKITPQEKACLASMRVCIAIIMGLNLGITRLEALIFM
jgi:hypothetical protein